LQCNNALLLPTLPCLSLLLWGWTVNVKH
jgi:hypothetical protein